MASTAAPPDEQDADSSSDEDFNPTAQAELDDSSAESSPEDAPTTTAPKHAKTTALKRQVAAAALDSGDEETMQERRNKKRKTAHKGKDKDNGGADDGSDFVDTDDSGGEVGFVKTRAQRRAEGRERMPLVGLAGATADVDAIWARLNAPRREDVGRGSVLMGDGERVDAGTGKERDVEEYVTIKRTYEFAGEVKTEEKRVLRYSEEARVWFEWQADMKSKGEGLGGDSRPTTDGNKRGVRRPLKRPSLYEPNPTGEVKNLPDNLQLRWPRTTDEQGVGLAGVVQTVKAKSAGMGKRVRIKAPDKVTTVDKSRMDWAGFVDKEGLAEELDEYGKAKRNFVDRGQFLAKMDDIRAEQGRQARGKQRQRQNG